MKRRFLKNLLYEQVARIGKAVSGPKRLELSADIKLTSAHLKALRDARLVTSRRDGKHVAHLPYARSMPEAEIERRLAELPVQFATEAASNGRHGSASARNDFSTPSKTGGT